MLLGVGLEEGLAVNLFANVEVLSFHPLEVAEEVVEVLDVALALVAAELVGENLHVALVEADAFYLGERLALVARLLLLVEVVLEDVDDVGGPLVFGVQVFAEPLDELLVLELDGGVVAGVFLDAVEHEDVFLADVERLNLLLVLVEFELPLDLLALKLTDEGAHLLVELRLLPRKVRHLLGGLGPRERVALDRLPEAEQQVDEVRVVHRPARLEPLVHELDHGVGVADPLLELLSALQLVLLGRGAGGVQPLAVVEQVHLSEAQHEALAVGLVDHGVLLAPQEVDGLGVHAELFHRHVHPAGLLVPRLELLLELAEVLPRVGGHVLLHRGGHGRVLAAHQPAVRNFHFGRLRNHHLLLFDFVCAVAVGLPLLLFRSVVIEGTFLLASTGSPRREAGAGPRRTHPENVASRRFVVVDAAGG